LADPVFTRPAKAVNSYAVVTLGLFQSVLELCIEQVDAVNVEVEVRS
jgi:hypothetical protein